MSTTMTAPARLQVRRLIKAPRAKVFEAWTKPELIKQWLGPSPCQIISSKIDLRVGGEYVFHVSKPDGEFTTKGVYREITPPSRLVFSWTPCTGDHGDTTVTVDLTEQNGGTEVCITHERLASEASYEGHKFGWTGSLDRMEKLFA